MLCYLGPCDPGESAPPGLSPVPEMANDMSFVCKLNMQRLYMPSPTPLSTGPNHPRPVRDSLLEE